MTSVATLQPEPARIVACTISRDVQAFAQLIDAMEDELGEEWGDLCFDDALAFLDQPDAVMLDFVAVAVNAQDEGDLPRIGQILLAAKARGIRALLIADQVSPVALHQLLRLGASEFLPYPLPHGALHDAILRLRAPVPEPAAPAPPATAPLPQDAEVAPTPRFKAKGDREGVVLPVHGLSGGSGSTTLAVNLAWELATLSKTDPPRVCLLDLDFQYGSVATALDLPRRETVFEFLSDLGTADSEAMLASMVTFQDRLHVLTAPADMLPLDFIGPGDIAHLVEMAAANFDYVLIDMPKTIVNWTETVLNRAHVYFVLMELDLRSAQNVLRLIRALKAEGLPHEKLRHVLNRAPRFTDLSGRSRARRLAESLDIGLEIQLPDGGVQVTQANDHGLPLAESAAKNPLRKEVMKLARSLHDLNKGLAQPARG
jgi:pilus assembly protein CpaE